MRLINTVSLKIEDFSGRKIPRYAILSHTWAEEELTFQDWIYAQGQDPPRWGWTRTPDEVHRLKSTKGYIKIVKACEHAHSQKSCQWLWADTVCIDKTSSAELSEAINSMFEWYRQAEVCLAFLADVPSLSEEEMKRCSRRTNPFRESRWFRRGWTLQELIAPWSVDFLSQEWTSLGTKATLASHISTITSIPQNCLSGNWSRIRDQASIAQKMSWAARRKTSRAEDRAYCLMGLFGINMPLLYGEGEKAFHRLQEEIIKQTEDLSFLAWKTDRSQTITHSHFVHWKLPPLADSPDQFSASRNVVTQKRPTKLSAKRIFMANTGLFIHRPLLSTLNRRFFFAHLGSEVTRQLLMPSEAVWMPIIKESASSGFVRSSFPASSLVTALDASSCRLYRETPSETCIQRVQEPSPDRQYLRRACLDHNESSSPRQVGILPVFSTRSSWVRVIESYPATAEKHTPMIFDLTQYKDNNHIYHGILILEETYSATTPVERRVGVHFLVVFNSETSKPLFWDSTIISGHREPHDSLALGADVLTDTIIDRGLPYELPATKESTARPAARPAEHQFRTPATAQYFDTELATRMKESAWLTAEDKLNSDVIVDMDRHWHKFRSDDMDERPLGTFVNLVLIGRPKSLGEVTKS
jgi:hypothetical protein